MRILLVTFAVLASPASAAIVTLDFTGTVYSFGDEGVLDGSIAVGSPFHLHVVYNESAPPSDTTVYAPTDIASTWIFGAPPYEMSFAVGNYLAVTGPLAGDPTNPNAFQVNLGDGSGPGQADSFAVIANGPVMGGSPNLQASFSASLYDSSATAVASSLQLASIPFDLASWDPWSEDGSWSIAQLVMKDPNDPSGAEAVVNGRIENIAVSRVPEPWAGLLAATLVGALAAVRSRF